MSGMHRGAFGELQRVYDLVGQAGAVAGSSLRQAITMMHQCVLSMHHCTRMHHCILLSPQMYLTNTGCTALPLTP